MARSRRIRETHRTSIVGDRAQVFLQLDGIEWPERDPLKVRHLRRWFPTLDIWPARLDEAGRGAAIMLDRFQFALHGSADDGGFEASGTHDGDAFIEVADGGSVDVYVAADIDVRRATEADLIDAARSGRLVGASVRAFRVETI